MLFLAIFAVISVTSIPEVLSVKKFATATKPPPPPPAPPLVVFDQLQTNQAEAPPQIPQTNPQAASQTNFVASPQSIPQSAPQARFEYYELIAPAQNGQNYNPTLSINNPDFSVVYRPQGSPQPQRPQQQRPPQRPQQTRPQRPSSQRPGTPPLYQFPTQPKRPNSQVLSKPTGPRPAPPRNLSPTPGHRFGPQAFNRQPV